MHNKKVFRASFNFLKHYTPHTQLVFVMLCFMKQVFLVMTREKEDNRDTRFDLCWWCPDYYIERHRSAHGAVLAVYGAHIVHGTVIPGVVPYMAYPGNFFQSMNQQAPRPARNLQHHPLADFADPWILCTFGNFAHFTRFCIFLHTCLSRNLYQFKPLYAV
jgi:hypothetical protein